jgi:polysaccharide deacetylase family protein (PEP-CTERM system associated)
VNAAKSSIVNALTVDLEEYYHALVFREGAGQAALDGLESRVEVSTDRVLALLAARGVKATFFVLGEVAADHPAIVRKIAGEGHEVACHGYAHEPVFRQTPSEFRTDVRRAKAILEDIVGTSVVGYRAPNFSIGRSEAWAYDILLEEGFHYDSSSYPILHDRYGDRSAPRFPYEVRRNGHGSLIQFPIATTRLLGVNLPIGGGGYFRLLPSLLFRYGIRRVNLRERQPVVFYFHPWELDPNQPRPAMPWRHRLRHYVGLGKEEAKLSCLLRDIRFNTVRNVLGI